MPGARDHLARDPGQSPARRPPAALETTERPAITGAADPRLAHGSAGAQADLMHVQRAAGNAAVSSLVHPTVQRAISIDEISTQVAAPPASQPDTQNPTAPTGTPAPDTQPARPEADAGGGGGDAEAAADHTITAAHIGLNAPMVEASGVLRAQTVIADSIVATNYTPGAGNIW